MIVRSSVLKSYAELFGDAAPRLFYAPGRVNLIGEHTDFNDGFVLPMAIDRGTIVAATTRSDRQVVAHSVNLQQTVGLDLDSPGPTRRGEWLDYIEGVARALLRRGLPLRGANLVIESDVPVGAGLSSSAALEISSGMALLALSGAEISRKDLALAGQEAEHTYVGTRCGIMDQLTSAFGRAGHALLIDCRSLEVTPHPLPGSEIVVVVCDTHVKHQLATSGYNERRADCEKGVAILRDRLPGIRALRDVSVEDLERHGDLLPETVRRRCRHVVNENARTVAAAGALAAGRMAEFGSLMWQSHRSLRDDYEVSCAELDALVEIAEEIDGVLGARMTGGGFGGCTVNLVRRGVVEQFVEIASAEYQRRFGIKLSVFVMEASEGAREVTEGMRDEG